MLSTNWCSLDLPSLIELEKRPRSLEAKLLGGGCNVHATLKEYIFGSARGGGFEGVEGKWIASTLGQRGSSLHQLRKRRHIGSEEP
eukprot:1156148-Pelagomonas_calceolata.AAC.4